MSWVHPWVLGATPTPVPYLQWVYLGYEQRARVDEGDNNDNDIVAQGQQCRRHRHIVRCEDKGEGMFEGV